ncbi:MULTISPECIES: hypothetical protein [unclassified Streptomyces]|uniref:hypothetical protein n=1 Tax=unclassified Streptomyces TaxID=2593676 RepID=UPI000DB9B26C|nr:MULTISPECIES: hypothetical protein [unclassified Streptomyces]MYT73663.1 hypothetical protein [Streptomyces sp. SID8367]RAJ85202.1 hypothetical protein K377_03683 [Streptomyces sp. PsTaAH-137]
MIHRPRVRALAFVTGALLLAGCASRPTGPARSPDDTIRAAQQVLTDRCLTDRGLTPPRPGQRARSAADEERVADALFGRPPAELSLTLANGIPVRAHTDGCLAAAQRTLYGDQKRWFRVSTVVNNLKPEAAYRHRSLTAVRERHRADLTAWQHLRSHALDVSARILRTTPDTTGGTP